MRYQLALSAEEITDRVSPMFCGVGMVRSEYLCRKINKYITLAEARSYIRTYVRRICEIFAPDPVWYRTTEMQVAQINVLEGCDHMIEERNPILGYRGIRRAVLYPEAFVVELKLIAELAEQFSNLHLLIPFVSDRSELIFVKDCIEKTGFKNQIGIMAETPSCVLCLDDFLDLGVQAITLGMSDLSSLIMGAYRGSGLDCLLHPAVRMIVTRARELTRVRGVPIGVAGHINRKFLRFIESLDFDYAVIHYSRLESLFGAEFRNLPYRDERRTINEKTDQLIQERNERLAIKAWRERPQRRPL